MADSGEQCEWGRYSAAAVTALRLVFLQLAPPQLAHAAAVCRTWRLVASDPALWRAALAEHCHIPHATLRAIANVTAEAGEEAWWWRAEAALVCGVWREARRLQPRGAALAHASLSGCGRLLALIDEDGAVTAWEEEADSWQMLWTATPGAGRWGSGDTVQWCPGERPSRLLAVGTLALAARGEAAVLSARSGRVAARAGCSAGAGASWVSGGCFLALELRRAAPAHYISAVWIYAADQETWSENEGIAEPLFRIYNEAQTHISHMVVVEVEELEETVTQHGELDAGAPGESYYRHTGVLYQDSRSSHDFDQSESAAMLVCGCAEAGQPRGQQRALAAWPLHQRRPPPLRARAQGDLRARLQRHRARSIEDDEDMDEEAVRALCSPPVARVTLPARLLGLTAALRAVWAFTADGSAACFALPSLQPLCRLQADPPPPAVEARPQYVWGAASRRLVAGAGAGLRVWGARSGLPCAGPRCGAARSCCLAPRYPNHLFVLTAHALTVWHAAVPPDSFPN